MALLRVVDGLWLKLGEDQLALLRRECGPKLVGKSVSILALLQCWIDPPLRKDESGMALLRTTHDLFRKLVGKGGPRLTFLRRLADPSLERRAIHWHFCNISVASGK